MNMDDSPIQASTPRTPPSRPIRHRLDSFPTDDIHGDSDFGEDEEPSESALGMPPSISLGAFPVFLIQDSPTRSGVSKTVALFPESPESAYGFQPCLNRTNLPGCNDLLHRIDENTLDAGEFTNYPEWEDGGYAQQTSAPPPIRMVHTSDDEWGPSHGAGGISRRPSIAKQGMEFGRRLYDEDETLVGHCDVSDKKLRPAALRYSSSTSTSLASPLSDTFSPGSTSCSVSTASSSRPSPGAPAECFVDFPTEVGGQVSLELEVGSSHAQTVVSSGSPAILELRPMRSQSDMKTNTPIDETSLFLGSPYMHSCFTLTSTDPGCNEPSTVSSAELPLAEADSHIRPSTPPLETQTPTVPSPYGQLGLFSHPHFRLSQLARVQQYASDLCLPSGQRSVSAPGMRTPASPVVNRRRAFSGTRELIPTGRADPTILGRLRSCSANSSDPRAADVQLNLKPSLNNLSVQTARSRSGSASGTLSHGPSTSGARTLNSYKSKDSVRSKFESLPGYAAFLREITLELWIDQASSKFFRPRFELHRYTPGQIAPARSGFRFKNRNSASGVTSPARRKSVIPSPISIPSTPHRPDQCSSAGSTTSPTALRFGPQSPSVDQEVEMPIQPHFLENWGVAEFTMKKRQGWNFHHGVAESDPKLRRLTINGVEDRDYLSRKASLSVKSNGVYTVKGTEDHGRFEWKLEYLVEDRRGPSGAVIPGEKTLTPLLFTCAPELLIPEQGKKVRLLHVMKKSITPRIHSSKMEPPMVPSTPKSVASSEESTPSHTSTSSAGKALETLAKIVRPSSSKSRSGPTTPKDSQSHAYSPSQTPVRAGRHAMEFTEHLDAFEPRKAASYSNARPDLREILDT
ncbi:unnamed protein product [Rhizoctonia solani]|uniref:Uncharacterized protein n=1 Tax=Rhizoctonia solani TaxID=456999 RepID=A0A8H3DHK4_9AGAM|nr:unnamed protein product [Rhizoctonia solani]